MTSFGADEDHDRLSRLLFDDRIGQRDPLRRLQHLRGGGIDEQEEHQDREYVHQRGEVHLDRDSSRFRDMRLILREFFTVRLLWICP